MATIDDMLVKLTGMTDDQVAAAEKEAIEQFKGAIWIANAGPQLAAFHSKADLLLYGGQGGGGKTDLLAGLALTQHQRSLILRPQYTDLGSIIERFTSVAQTKSGHDD